MLSLLIAHGLTRMQTGLIHDFNNSQFPAPINHLNPLSTHLTPLHSCQASPKHLLNIIDPQEMPGHEDGDHDNGPFDKYDPFFNRQVGCNECSDHRADRHDQPIGPVDIAVIHEYQEGKRHVHQHDEHFNSIGPDQVVAGIYYEGGQQESNRCRHAQNRHKYPGRKR